MSENRFAQLFLDLGEGYSEANSIRIPINYGQVNIMFDLSEYEGIRSARLDPVNRSCCISDVNIEITYADGTEELGFGNSNAEFQDDSGNVFFFNPDPIIRLNLEENKSVSNLIVSFTYQSDEHILGQLKHQVLDIDKERASYQIKQTADLMRSINNKLVNLEADMFFQKGMLNKTIKELSYASSTSDQQTIDLINAFKDLQNKVENKLVSRFEALEKSQESDMVSNLKDQISKLQEELDKEKATSEALQKQIEDSIKSHEKLQTSMELSIKELEKISLETFSVLRKENEQLNHLIKKASKKEKSLKKDIGKLSAEIARLQEENVALQSISRLYSQLNKELEYIAEEKEN